MTEPTELAEIVNEAVQSALSSWQQTSISSQISDTINSTITQHKNGRAKLGGNSTNLISMVKVKARSIEASDNQIKVMSPIIEASGAIESQEDIVTIH